jgi:hypothetical protein
LVVGNAAAVVTNAIKECIGKVPFVEDSGNYTARSLRSGGLQEVVINFLVFLEEAGGILNTSIHSRSIYLAVLSYVLKRACY